MFAAPRRLCALLIALALCGASAQLTNNGAKLGEECPDVCGYCSGDGSCADCAPGAMQVGRPSPTGAVTCVKCQDPRCMECGPTPDKCTSCDSSWTDPSTGIEWPVYQGSDARCYKCVNNPSSSGCQACDRSGRCTECGTGYVLTAGRVCKKCKGGDACDACDPATQQCTACGTGYGLDAQRQCRSCTAGLDADGVNLCADCSQDYRACKECEAGYYVNARKQCSQLPDNCDAVDAHGVCTECLAGNFLTADKRCISCGEGCAACASATTCASCDSRYVITPQKTCLRCSPDCMECSIVSPGRTRCTQCGDLTLINGECRRCEDPRCDDCSGNARVCKACKDRAHRVNNATGRCEDPSWPTPCRQSSGGAGRRGSCGTPTPQRPKTVQAQRRLHASGSVVAPAIINGQNATRGRFPYMVSMRFSKDQDHNCGAGLVHERVALTAAHCILRRLDWAAGDLVFAPLRIGGYERIGGQYEARRVKWAVVHPGVDDLGTHLVNDLALLLLDRPSTMRPLLRLPNALPRPAAAAGTLLTAIGWGMAQDEYGQRVEPDVLQQAVIDMMPLKSCAAYFPTEPWEAQFCAGRPEKRVDTCQGDSGGPVIWRSPAGPAGDLAVGVVSWGKGCASDTPGVYADVAVASQWIKNTIQWLLFEDAAGRIPGPGTK